MKAAYSVTGPGVERSAGSSALGLSAATTYANRATIAGVEASFYVRDPNGTVVGRADSDGSGGVLIYGQDSLTSGPSDGRRLSAAPPVGRPEGRPRRPRKPSTANPPATGDNVASGSVELDGATSTEGRTGMTDKNEKTKAAKAAETAGGEDLVKALMGALETKIGQKVEKKTNLSGTYSRLLVKGKAFAYLFPPRPNGVLLKIPKQLLGVEKDLPKGHGFKKVGWGLTRTISKNAEVETAASALAVAANATTQKEAVAA